MKLLLIALGWATLFAFPCLWVSEVYQRVLAVLAMLVLALFRQSVSIAEVQVMSPFDIGLFIALCLATTGATWRERRRAILIGIPIMIVAEVAVVVLGILPTIIAGEHPQPSAGAERLGAYTIESVPWVSAFLVWLVLIGARYVWPESETAARAGGAPTRGAPGDAAEGRAGRAPS